MSRLTRTQRASIERALHAAERTHAYLHDGRRAICDRTEQATTTLHYTRAGTHGALYEVAKHSSDIVGIETCIESLRALLASAV